jgi:S-DNA-T family DNA segregation ATPase FtsK/SpoIIIE
MTAQTFPVILDFNTLTVPSGAPPLAFPLGVTGEGVKDYADLAQLPHLLIVGPSGSGKSMFLHTMLSTWIARNTANNIELWLADHSGGVELARYNVLMRADGHGIVRQLSYKAAETTGMLDAALEEIDRRLERLRQTNCATLADYAHRTGLALCPLALVIDGLHHLMEDTPFRSMAEHLIAKIAATGRAAGVHLVITSQSASKSVLTPLIVANIETRAVFCMDDWRDSQYVIGSHDAVGLPQGRIIWRARGGELREIQTPMIRNEQIQYVIDQRGASQCA